MALSHTHTIFVCRSWGNLKFTVITRKSKLTSLKIKTQLAEMSLEAVLTVCYLQTAECVHSLVIVTASGLW